MIGFRKIIDIISAYKKPIVGHNMLLGKKKLSSSFIIILKIYVT